MQNYSTKNFLNWGFSRFSASLFLGAMLAALAGCGSGGGGDGPSGGTSPTDNTTTPATTAASIQLLASSPQMASSGTTAVDLTAVVLSANKQVVAGRTVTFSAGSDPTAYVSNLSASGVSDTNGLVTAKLNLGVNKANRTITLTASADGATTSNSVDVTGTTITVSGNNSLTSGNTTTLTFSVKDSAGTALPGITVSVTSQTGNTIALTPATGITNSSGQITAAVKATAVGNDVITASAAGASVTQVLIISPDSFAFAPLANTDIPLGTAQPVSINWTTNSTPKANTPVSFAVSRGTVSLASVNTNINGVASVTVSSAITAGPAIITASGQSGTPAATLDVVFVATSASSATVQAVPGTVAFTTGSASQTNNSSTISAVVRDSNGNLVKNAGVSFTITNDPTAGRLTSSSGITDVSGSTSVTYVAGGTSSAQNGVTISASVNTIGGVPITPVTGTTTLTVSGQSLLVRLGTDNKVATTALPQNANQKTYVAIVTDAAGNPVVGTTVQFALRPGRYEKGIFVPDSTGNRWVQLVTVTCPNEDLNFNSQLDPGEGLVTWPVGVTPALLPGAVAAVNPSGVTDTNGVATATITYAKSFSLWTEITLEARTSVTSNDPPTQTTFFLPGAAADYTPITNAPPPIPFGSDNTCADTL